MKKCNTRTVKGFRADHSQYDNFYNRFNSILIIFLC